MMKATLERVAFFFVSVQEGRGERVCRLPLSARPSSQNKKATARTGQLLFLELIVPPQVVN